MRIAVLHCWNCYNIYIFSVAYGDLRIREGSDSGLLEFDAANDGWLPICRDGFDNDAGDVACRQLGYVEASDVYTYSG